MLAAELKQPSFYLLPFVLFFGPVADTLYWGNNEILILFLLVVVLRGLSDKSNCLSGVALGLAILWKLFPLILMLYFLILRRWRSLEALSTYPDALFPDPSPMADPLIRRIDSAVRSFRIARCVQVRYEYCLHPSALEL